MVHSFPVRSKFEHPETLTASTPATSVYDSQQDDHDTMSTLESTISSFPEPDSTFIIKSTSSGLAIAVSEGKVVQAPPGGKECHWVCIQTDGWLGFRNPVSGKFLGRNDDWHMACVATAHERHEWFHVRSRQEGHVLMQIHKEMLRPVGFTGAGETKTLAMMENWASKEIHWEFIRV